MVSEKQRELIVALGTENENHHVVHDKLKISRGAMNSRLSRAFNEFMDDLRLFHKYFPVFERNFKRTPEAYTMLRSIARRTKSQ